MPPTDDEDSRLAARKPGARPPRRHRPALTAVLSLGAITILALGIVTAQGLLIGVGLMMAGIVGLGIQR